MSDGKRWHSGVYDFTFYTRKNLVCKFYNIDWRQIAEINNYNNDNNKLRLIFPIDAFRFRIFADEDFNNMAILHKDNNALYYEKFKFSHSKADNNSCKYTITPAGMLTQEGKKNG